MGELLDQHEGSAEAGFDMGIPGGAGRIVPLVALERAGVVDQYAEWPECLGGRRRQPLHRRLIGEVRGHQGGAPAQPANRLAGRLPSVAAGMAMDRDVEPCLGERQRDRASDTLRSAGHQGSARNRCGYVGHHRGRRCLRTVPASRRPDGPGDAEGDSLRASVAARGASLFG